MGSTMASPPTTTRKPTADKPPIVQRRSCGSVRVAFLDKERAIAELVARVQALLEQDPRVIAVGLFGSLARGDALPGSDADLLIVLKSHPQSRWFDRISEYALPFQGTALPVEPLPYTVDELIRLSAYPGLVRTALREILPLGGERSIFQRLSPQ
jgi:UTP:GlnB (protein PII) uridylyltransferase